jgi:hypothetical protein
MPIRRGALCNSLLLRKVHVGQSLTSGVSFVSAKYLLPCHCGQHVVVEPRQAGETVVCSCGVLIQVPTMLGMKALEPAMEETFRANADWGWPHRTLLVGLVLVAAAIAAVILLWSHRPVSSSEIVTPEQIQANARQLTPIQTWTIWETMKQGLDQRIDQPYVDAMTRFHIWMTVAAICLVVGAGMTIAGWAKGGRFGVAEEGV